MKLQKGFTLIELMVVVAIVAILAAIGYPSYRDYMIRSHRSAAQGFMLKIASREEQYLLDARTYANSLATLGLTQPVETTGKYSFAIAVATAATDPGYVAGVALPQYTITATATGGQVADGNLTLDSSGTKTPAAKWQ